MLGSVLLEHCLKNGIEAVGTSRLQADICQPDQLEKVALALRPTHMINCAAYTDVDGAEKNAQAAFAINSEGASNVAMVAREFRSRLVHISTDYVFDGLGANPYVEEDACAPINVYGKSKWEGEKKVLEILPHACVLRTSWVFGSKGKNFISSLVNWFQHKEALQVVSDQCGKPTYCYDLACAIMTLLEEKGIVHFANEGGTSRYQIALNLLEIMRQRGFSIKCQKISPVLSAQFPTPAARPSFSVLDTSKYVSLTSIHPRPWVEAVKDYLNEV